MSKHKKFIAFSGGVESTTMCLLYGAGATAIFTDTGAEHAEMYNRINKVESALKEYHNGNFELIRINGSEVVDGKETSTLTDYIKAKHFFPSVKTRFCTYYFKIKPLDNFLKKYQGAELMIGLNSEELDRAGNLEEIPDIKYSYPLLENGLTRQDCIDILSAAGLAPTFPAYMRRGGCIYCFFKSKKEYKAMVHLSLGEIELVREIEELIQDKRNKYFRIRADMPPLAEFIKAEQNNIFGDLSPYYDESDAHYSCGVFCHR